MANKLSWWTWLATVLFLMIGVFLNPVGFLLAIILTVINYVNYLIREGSVKAFPVQVRLGTLLFFCIAFIEPLRFIYWISIIGIWAQVLFGYCHQS